MQFNSNQEFTNRDISPNSKMNNLLYDLDIELSRVFSRFNYKARWKKFFKYTNSEKQNNNPAEVVIEFSSTNGERNTIDWIDITLRKLNINFKYINVSDLTLIDSHPLSHGNSGKIFIQI